HSGVYPNVIGRSAASRCKPSKINPVVQVEVEAAIKVADWLKYIENGAAKSGTADPMGTYDFTWMWEELGLSDLRR
ncbi:hypothetical protein ACFOOJ_13605, partial [Sphingobium xenophagum]|uniref:hypothetical protein n=2 Tax=Sphingobium TaxID=165695 RepID=UPI003620BF6F